MSLIASGVCFAYSGDSPLFENVDLAVHRGESAAIMAPSGTGKSTLLSILGGLRSPLRGAVTIESNDMPTAPRRARVAWIFQFMHLLSSRSVIDNVAIAALAAGMRRTHAERLARTELDRFGAGPLSDRRQGTLSGGETQRVALARAAIGDPVVVLADEPTANLDRENAQHLAQVLMSGFPRAAVVVMTHDPLVARRANVVYQLGRRGLEPLVLS